VCVCACVCVCVCLLVCVCVCVCVRACSLHWVFRCSPGAPRAQGPYTGCFFLPQPYTGCFFVPQRPLGPRGERPGPCHRQPQRDAFRVDSCIALIRKRTSSININVFCVGKHIFGTETIVFLEENVHVAHNSLHFLPNLYILCQLQSPLSGSCPSACSGGGSAARVECTAIAHGGNPQGGSRLREKKCPRGKVPTQFRARSVQAVAHSSIHEHITPCGARTHDLWLIRPSL
jgi:hypothetical protein